MHELVIFWHRPAVTANVVGGALARRGNPASGIMLFVPADTMQATPAACDANRHALFVDCFMPPRGHGGRSSGLLAADQLAPTGCGSDDASRSSLTGTLIPCIQEIRCTAGDRPSAVRSSGADADTVIAW